MFTNKHLKRLDSIGDLMLLNLLMIITSLPVFTLGASLSAGAATMETCCLGESTSLIKNYFANFKKYFKKGTIIYLVFLSLVIFLIVDILVLTRLSGSKIITGAIFGSFCFAATIIILTFIHIFPLSILEKMPLKESLTKSFYLSVRMLPKTLLTIISTLLPIFIMFYSIKIGVLIWLLFGLSLPLLLSYQAINTSLKKETGTYIYCE